MPFKYKVKTGDTLWAIARRFRTTIEDIMDINPDIIDEDKIYVGQIILIMIIKSLILINNY